MDVTAFQGQTVVVLGLGKSGVSAVMALAKGGAEVIAWDDRPENRNHIFPASVVVADPTSLDWTQVSALILSPGIPHTYPTPHPVAIKANAHNVPLLSDIELFVRTLPTMPVIAITGTNGKSTTTAMIHHILTKAEINAQMGGNIGVPALELSPDAELTVLELSSYQLEISPTIKPDVAILLNITPDHLNRHGGFEGYVAAKKRIFANQDLNQRSIIGVDDDASQKIYEDLKAHAPTRVIPISGKTKLDDGISVVKQTLFDRSRPVPVTLDLSKVPGIQSFNAQNIAATYAVLKGYNIAPEDFVTHLATFKALEHRQELVGTVNGIPFINDSKATNLSATEQALRSYPAIYWIVGGEAKEEGIDHLSLGKGHIQKAYLIGASQDRFAQTLGEKSVAYERAATLETAVQQAQNEAIEGSVVLFSPACASFDAYKNFEERGEHFKKIVQELPGTHT